DVEDSALTNLLTRTDGVFHGGMGFGSEHKTNARFFDGFGNFFGGGVEADAEGREDIRCARLVRSNAGAMFWHFWSRARQDKCRGSGNVEGMRAVTARTDDIVDGFSGVEFDFHRVGAHGAH